ESPRPHPRGNGRRLPPPAYCGEDGDEPFAVPAADQLVTMRKAGALAVEQRGAACCSRCVDGQNHDRFLNSPGPSVFTGTGTRQVGKSAKSDGVDGFYLGNVMADEVFDPALQGYRR